METSQQQRRSAVGQLAETLADADLAFDALDLVDVLWLAQFIEPEDVERVEDTVDKSEVGQQGDFAQGDESKGPPAVSLFPDGPPPSRQSQQEQQAQGAQGDKPKGIPFSVPAAPALRTRLDLARALRPLMRQVPSRTRFDLDEDATVTRIAETEVWMPVVRPRPERWLELDLVVEDSKTTVIWERSIAELNHLAEYQGAFRAVRTWRLCAQDGTVRVFPRWLDSPVPQAQPSMNQRPRNPSELVDPTGRRLIWFVTDCTSQLWRQGLIHDTLLAWSKVQSVAIVQMFPERLWSRTALRDGHLVSLSALIPGVPSARLEVEGLPRRLELQSANDLVTMPIVTLDAQSLGRWARVVSGAGGERTLGRSFDLAFVHRQAEQVRTASRAPRAAVVRTAEERVALFRSTSSKTVRQLANLMAAAPVSLPVIDLLREAFRADFDQEVRQSHVAEVLLSGLLRRCDQGDEACRYEFFGDSSPQESERVRYILLGDASVAKTLKVLNVLSESICKKQGIAPRSFQALLGELKASESELRDAVLPFARVGVDVLLRLGGEHAELARRVEFGSSDDHGISRVQFPPLTDFDFIDARFVEGEASPLFPPELKTETFTILTLESGQTTESTEALEPFDITVATLIDNQGQWQIQRQQQTARRYIELLSEKVALEMVAIPGDTFIMGSPDDEPERYGDESPQHEVTIEPFFMGRYPITQAQWRVVAALPQVERELVEADPSNFKGDNRPVEQVSWYDAVEFCARLSAHTGREYRLPTEAEWEYACRAGTTTAFHFGDMITTEVANYDGSSYAGGPEGKGRDATTPVGELRIANAFGLSDMHGNVDEWCHDQWHDSYEDAPKDGGAWLIPDADDEQTSRLIRGGSWANFPWYCRSAFRNSITPGNRNLIIGFRVVCSAPRILP